MLALFRNQMLMFLATSTFATSLQLERPDPILQLVPLNFTNSQTIHSPSLNEGPCFMPSPDRIQAACDDCYAAIDKLEMGHDGRTSYIFGRGSRVTYKLPKTFHSGSCTLTLDMVHDDQKARLTIEEIAHTASILIARCTTDTIFKYGGVMAVGPSNVLYITIIGTAMSSTS